MCSLWPTTRMRRATFPAWRPRSCCCRRVPPPPLPRQRTPPRRGGGGGGAGCPPLPLSPVSHRRARPAGFRQRRLRAGRRLSSLPHRPQSRAEAGGGRAPALHCCALLRSALLCSVLLCCALLCSTPRAGTPGRCACSPAGVCTGMRVAARGSVHAFMCVCLCACTHVAVCSCRLLLQPSGSFLLSLPGLPVESIPWVW